jgi:hypothetical protein
MPVEYKKSPEYTEGSIFEADLSDLNSMTFYKQYLTKSTPLLVRDGCENWQALQRWNNMIYLWTQFGMQSIQIHRLEKDLSKPDSQYQLASLQSKRNNFGEFLKKVDTESEDGKYLYFIRNEMIVNKVLAADYIKPGFISSLVRNRATGLTVWKDFERKPEYKDRERYFCVVDGQESFRMVSPIYKQNIYSGVLEQLMPQETPLDFFTNIDTMKYPLFAGTKVIQANVNKG